MSLGFKRLKQIFDDLQGHILCDLTQSCYLCNCICVMVNYLFMRKGTSNEEILTVEAQLHALTSTPGEVIWSILRPGRFSSWEKTLTNFAWETGWAESRPGSGGELKNSCPCRQLIFDRSVNKFAILIYPDQPVIKKGDGMHSRQIGTKKLNFLPRVIPYTFLSSAKEYLPGSCFNHII